MVGARAAGLACQVWGRNERLRHNKAVLSAALTELVGTDVCPEVISATTAGTKRARAFTGILGGAHHIGCFLKSIIMP